MVYVIWFQCLEVWLDAMELKWSKLLVANVKPLYMRLSHCVRLSSPLSLHFASAPHETRLSQSPLSLCRMSVCISVSLLRPASLFEQRRLSHAHALWTVFLADTDAVRGFSSARLGYLPTITFRLSWNTYFAISYLVCRLQGHSRDKYSTILECHRFLSIQKSENQVTMHIYILKVKQSRYRPGVVQRVPGSWGSQISWQRHRVVVRLSALRTARLYPQEMHLALIPVRGCVDPKVIVRPEGLCHWKMPMTPSGIEPANFSFVA